MLKVEELEKQLNQGCAEGIVKVINDKELQEKLIQNMKSTNYSNESEIEKLYELIDWG